MSYWARPSKRTRRGDATPSSSPKPELMKTPSPKRTPPRPIVESPNAAIRTAQHLRDSGWRDAAKDEEADENTFCTCRAPEEDFDIEECVKCLNRGCKIEYFHLKCMTLPDQPPRGIGWNCPTCRIVSAEDVSRDTGLFDQRHHDGGNGWKDWMISEGFKVKGYPPKKSAVQKKVAVKSPKDASGSERTISDELSPTLKRKRDVNDGLSSPVQVRGVQATVESSSSSSDLTEFYDDDE